MDGNKRKPREYVDMWITIPVNLYDPQIVKPPEPLNLSEIITKTL